MKTAVTSVIGAVIIMAAFTLLIAISTNPKPVAPQGTPIWGTAVPQIPDCVGLVRETKLTGQDSGVVTDTIAITKKPNWQTYVLWAGKWEEFGDAKYDNMYLEHASWVLASAFDWTTVPNPC